ncbi:hypothetical protein QQS21_002514 [Conoideocrella luteorostrata]|uniref:Polyketide synthase n=1 Tax=Conoideocrella luteorostrata TaxID=1105319 RepID=A0AAJ0CY31_9HYPO|nr:hypothetical protein QQS21_002514 [Conoideocrella luteorostrata]
MVRTVTPTMMGSKTLLLFGPGAMSLDVPYFSSIMSFVKDDSGSKWALQAIEDLESYWSLLCKAVPKLHRTPGVAHARQLTEWLQTGTVPPPSSVASLPNAILGPLVIISHLVEYLQYLSSQTQAQNTGGKSFIVPSPLQTETVGCCLGVFSALVVSSSSSWTQFCHNAAAVLRTVFVLGALSDAQDAPDSTGASLSLIAFWRGGQSLLDLERILAKFPEAYTSVLYDDNRATLTTSASTVAALKSHLQTAGITANETEFHGRFHAGRVYEDDLQALISFFNKFPAFQLPDSSCLVLPTRVNSESVVTGQDHLLEAASHAFLVEQFNWIKTFRSAVTASLKDRNSKIIEFGPEKCVPPTLLRRLSSQVTHFDFEKSVASRDNIRSTERAHEVAESDVAVIGMSCNVAGAQDADEFWNILLAGQSQHRELVPNDRFVLETSFRPQVPGDEKKKWYGNFIGDHDAFDHKFFKKSPREALHMDPQQRLILQTAYQAVAQSGYYHKCGSDNRIGCYIGVVANDYENNISHTSPTAFSATGALRSYIAGKVSHYFGWTGPGMTLDTACSASTVAIDLACRAILSGDCTAALAGGTNFYSTPMFFQNLAAGSFLSATGQCKPFDAKADGYCRGEAIGAVFLKKLSNAIADGDQILGVISATAINQNLNTTPIFVPNPVSLTEVFRTVIKKSGLDIKNVSVVEAHGTGTPVGDPAEYDSIRQVFGGSTRQGDKPLQIGSVKGLIGHTEGASGVIALIKILLMMQAGRIPPQASFNSINPAIKASPSDNMEITRNSVVWTDPTKIALINNYGAAGSNASMVIKQAPRLCAVQEKEAGDVNESTPPPASKYPFYISGLDERSISAYAKRLDQFVAAKRTTDETFGMESLAFNLNRQSNWSLGRALVFSSDSLDNLQQSLRSLETFAPPVPRPVILCFGGQVAKFIGLDRQVFDNTTVLRHHLNQCDSVCKLIGSGSIYPAIFQRDPIDDASVLQPLLFAMQYSCAMSWIDCGVEPAALVGHSFGELTALCVSGALDLENALKMVYGRSKVIRDSWGAEKGAMIAVEADLGDVESLLDVSNALLEKSGGVGRASIACFNGPRSFTLAGSANAIDLVQQTISTQGTTLKHKRLDVTNAFHSTLVEPLKGELEALDRELIFKKPEYTLERATKEQTLDCVLTSYVADHMRQPVYFNHAVQRLGKQYPEAVWLEAGSNSTITTMASRALGMPKASSFQPVNITGTSQGLNQLTEATMSLWRAGLRVSFWPHSRKQTYQYAPMILPPYQFEKHRHWLEFKPPPKETAGAMSLSDRQGMQMDAPPAGLIDFLGYLDDSKTKCRFRINTKVDQYVQVASEHIIANKTACPPATFKIDLAIQAIQSIRPELKDTVKFSLGIYNIADYRPILQDEEAISLHFENIQSEINGWIFKYISRGEKNEETVHMSGQLFFQPVNTRYSHEFARFERLVTHERCLRALESSEDADDVIQGQNIYKVFSDIVKFGQKFRHVRKLVGRGRESAGRVLGKRSDDSWLDFALCDAFTQVAGIWVNCMSQNHCSIDDTIYLVTGIEQWMRSPELPQGTLGARGRQKEWQVLAQHKHIKSDSSFISDIFVFDSESGLLEEVIIGVQYSPVPREHIFSSLKIRSTATSALDPRISPDTFTPTFTGTTPGSMVTVNPVSDIKTNKQVLEPIGRNTSPKKNAKADIWVKLLPVLADISGLEPSEIKETDSLADIGIDSLMGMEMAREVETTFSCTLEQSELVSMVDVPSILSFLQSTLGLQDGDAPLEISDSSLDSSPSSSDGASTPNSMTEEADLPRLHIHDDKSVDLPPSVVLEAFRESKARTDYFLKSHGCSGYLNGVSQKQTRLCLVLTSAAFKQLGCDLESAEAGHVLQPVPFVARHQRFHEYLYKMLEETRIIDIDDGVITRTAIPLPSQSADAILEDLMRHHLDNSSSHQLTYNVGSRMADVLSGKADGPQLIFGDAKNRELVAQFYGELPFNKLCFEQMADFLTRLATKLRLASQSRTTLKILEMGAGTGGTTKVLAPVLAKLGIPVEYTFTDLSPSLVAQARRKFKQYPFMKFAVHDIEQPPSDPQLFGTQHIVIASNAVHATHSLNISTKNIHKFLRPDGFLMMLEMMGTLHWVDVVWGTLEGWWLFDDGRKHAIVDEKRWETELLGAGYKQVDWTEGKLPEARVQRVLIALAAGGGDDLYHSSATATDDHDLSKDEMQSRKSAANHYVEATAQGFSIPEYSEQTPGSPGPRPVTCILITGATGSLGGHLASHLASLPSVDTIYCFNRHGAPNAGAKARDSETAAEYSPLRRQIQSLESKGIDLPHSMLAKLKVIEADSSKPKLGLDDIQYKELLSNVTHIIHNAFPVNGLRSLKQNEPQFATMRNLVDLAADISARRKQNGGKFKFTFQFISSLSAVGKYPSVHRGETQVPEEHLDIDSALPNGYGGAKVICERILLETLGRHPEHFRAMTVRLGQLSGSMKTGYWNHMEVLGFLFKSAQTVRAFPDIEGVLSWLPLEEAAASLSDLLLHDGLDCHAVYHVDNPIRRDWKDMITVLAEALGIPEKAVIPLTEWLRRVQIFPGENPWDNPAAKAMDFFEHKFQHMSCGGVTMATDNAREHSETLRNVRPVSDDVVKKYFQVWKTTGFLR